MNDLVTKWVREAVALVRSGDRTFESAHLDEIFGEQACYSIEDLAALLHAGSDAMPGDWDGLLLLAVPYEATEEQVMAFPHLEALPRDEYEPPSFYVIRSEADLVEEPTTEICRIPVQPPPALSEIRLEFASRRDAYARSERWEFTNTLWMRPAGA